MMMMMDWVIVSMNLCPRLLKGGTCSAALAILKLFLIPFYFSFSFTPLVLYWQWNPVHFPRKKSL